MMIQDYLKLEKYIPTVEEKIEANIPEQSYFFDVNSIYVSKEYNKYTSVYCKTKSKRLLVVIGESWTFGDNLVPYVKCIDDKDNIPYRISTIFSGRVAKYLKSDLLLNSLPGNSNINHLYRLTEYIDAIQSDGTYDEIFLIFQLTSPGRDFRNDLVDEPIKHLFSKVKNEHPILKYDDWCLEYDKTYFNLINKQVNRLPFNSAVIWKNFNEFHYKNRDGYNFNVIEHPFMRLAVQMSGYDFIPSKNMEQTFYENIDSLYNISYDLEILDRELDRQNVAISLLPKSLLNNWHPNYTGHWFLSALMVDKFKNDGF